MAFKRFSRTAARTDTGAKWLGVQGNGSISLSYATMKEIGVPSFVHLLYDESTNRIAIQSADSDSSDAYPARKQGRGDNEHGARVISASAFFRYIGVDAKRAAGRYDVTIEDDMVVAQLSTDALTKVPAS